MNKTTIFLDLDGTIFDVSERIYQDYRDILKKYKKKYLKKNDYMELKRKKFPIREILQRTGARDISLKFIREYEKKIEDPYYLKLDKILNSKKKTLLDLRNDYKLVLLTSRKHPQRLFDQLKKKGIYKIFDKILVGKDKHNIIKKSNSYSKRSIIVGDTETDILIGKHFGIKTVVVADGMRNKSFLKKYKPDILINDISKLKRSI